LNSPNVRMSGEYLQGMEGQENCQSKRL
jgi:hypothetical protein